MTNTTTVQKNINAKVRASLKHQKPLCGECSGFNDERLLDKCKSVCSKAEKISSSDACPSFAPAVRQLSEFSQKRTFEPMVEMFAELPDDSLRVLASILYNEKRTRKAGYFFGQKVYVRYRGANSSNYLSNFMIAHVMYVSNEHYRLMSMDGKCVLTYGIQCRPNIFTVDQFADLRTKMLKKNKLVDPDVERLLSKRFQAEEEHELNLTKESAIGNVTTIDKVFKENGVRKSKQKTTTLIDLVSRAASGYEVTKQAGKYDSEVKRNRGEKDNKAADHGGDVIFSVGAGAEY